MLQMCPPLILNFRMPLQGCSPARMPSHIAEMRCFASSFGLMLELRRDNANASALLCQTAEMRCFVNPYGLMFEFRSCDDANTNAIAVPNWRDGMR